jgi:predicted transcriptional regulator
MDTSRAISNAERYKHIPTEKIVKLSGQGLSHREIGKLEDMGKGAVRNRLKAAGIVFAPEKLTESQLKEARLDPAWQARKKNRGIVPPNRVVCLECGELKSELNANGNHSHLQGQKHNMTADDYGSKYPGARLVNFKRSADANSTQGGTKTVEDLMDEFAALYLTPVEREEVRRDPEWEEHHGDEFVACRICGFKYKSDMFLHLKRHGLTPEAYHHQFPKAPLIPLRMKRGYRRDYARKRGRTQRKELAELRGQVEQGKAAAARLEEIEKAPGPFLIGDGRMVMKKPGPKLDVERGAYVYELREVQRLQWDAVLERVEARFRIKTTVPALRELLARYSAHLALQKKHTR